MANENKTVEQVALSDRPLAEQIRILRGNYSIGSGEFDALDEAADVVECHQREIADFQRRYDECVRKFNEVDADRCRLRDEVAAKDAEIEKLKAYISENDINGDTAVACLKAIKEAAEEKMAEILSLRALVKELADALDRRVFCRQNCTGCKVGNGDNIRCASKVDRSLVAKAREACK